MALVLADRVQETSTSPGGTGTLNLSGTSPAGFKTFSSGIGTGNSTYYCIFDTVAYDWEVGIGTYTSGSPGTLSRTTVLSNSAGTTSAISFTNGNTLNVFVTYPSEKSINYDANGVATIGSTLGYSDTGVIASFASTVAGYNQVVVQNKSASNAASANFNVSNDSGSATDNYAEFGINSSTFVGDSSFDLPGAAYLSSASTPLTIGTYSADAIHFITNGDSTTTDAMTIYEDGSVTLGGLPQSGIGNISCNNINLKFQQIATTGGTTTLTNASPYYTQFTGTSAQNLVLPDATTCLKGTTFILDNDSTQNVTIKNGASVTFELLVPGGFHTFVLEDNSTVAGTWLRYSQVPSTVEWGTNSLSLSTTVITGGTWNGGTIAVGYGGTGLTSLTSGGALYATSSSTMTSGTLPVTAGGTGQTSFTSGYIPYGNSSAALQSSASLQFNGTYLVVGGTTPLSGATNPISAFSSTANNYVQTYTYNANTGTSASADFVAYANNSTDAHGWADMGFTSSTYADAVYTVTGPNEAYIFGSAPSGASKTGNLVYATDSTGTANAHQWYVGGFTQAKGAWKMQLTSTGLQLANALAVSYGGLGITTTPSNGQIPIGNGTNYTAATITAGTGISVTNSSGGITITNTSPSSGGTVTSVSGTSPVSVATGTTTPVISLASGYGDTQNPYASKTANYFLAAPNGSAGAPTFRAVVAADIPTLNQNTTGTAGGLSGTPNITVGTVSAGNITTSGAYLRSVAGTGYLSGSYAGVESTTTSGAIYSIGGSYVPGSTNLGTMYGIGYGYSGNAGITATGAPSSRWGLYVASGGTSRIFLDSDGGNGYFNGTVYSGGTALTGNTGTVTSVSGTGSVNGITLSGTVTSSGSLTLGGTLSGVSLTSQVSGTLPIANGGTNNGSLAVTAGGVLYTDGTKVVNVGAGTSGQILLSTGSGAPAWRTATYAIDYLVVAGGGGGGGNPNGGGGGGGAGGYVAGSTTVSAGASIAVVVGSGGTNVGNLVYASGGDGGTSSLALSTAVTTVGGGGGAGVSAGPLAGRSGGSGGGAAAGGSAGQVASGGAGTSGQGNAGGASSSQSAVGYSGGGGGGASAVGGNGVAGGNPSGGAGGNGTNWQSLGTYYAGGGGGGGNNIITKYPGGAGGQGGGGTGGKSNPITSGVSGTANTGGGGGGACTQDTGTVSGSGGSGVVIIRYLSATQQGTGGTVTSSGGYYYHTFTTSGTYVA